MEIINKPMVKLDINEIEALRKLKLINIDIDNDLIFNCEFITQCSECPLKMDGECSIALLYDTINFIDSVTTEE